MYLEDLAYSHAYGYDLLQQLDTKQNMQREKALGVKSGANQVQISKSSPAGKSHRSCLSPDNIYEMSITKACQGLGAQNFSWALVDQAWSVKHIPKVQAFKGKRIFSINHTICTVLGIVSHFDQEMVGTLLKPTSLGGQLKANMNFRHLKHPMLTLFSIYGKIMRT